jgi:hypothetical protein
MVEGAGAEDLILLLTLVVDCKALRTQTCYGEELYAQWMIDESEEESKNKIADLVKGAREKIASATSTFCMEMIRRVVGRTKEAATRCSSRKDSLMNEFMEDACVKEGRRMVYPTLMQVFCDTCKNT